MNDNTNHLVIMVDMREQRSKVCVYLEENRKVVVKYIDLVAGDYICGPGVAVERKESIDFINSIIDNRLFSQVRFLKVEYARPIIIIEGDIFRTHSQISPSVLIGAISYISVIEGISIIHSYDAQQTAQMLETMTRHSQQGLGYEVALRSQKPKGSFLLSQFIVEGIPSIGPKTAQNLLKRFKSVAQVFSASEKELCEVPGIGKKTASRIHEILHFPYEH